MLLSVSPAPLLVDLDDLLLILFVVGHVPCLVVDHIERHGIGIKIE